MERHSVGERVPLMFVRGMRWHIGRFVYYQYVPVAVNYFEGKIHGNNGLVLIAFGVGVMQGEDIALGKNFSHRGVFTVNKDAVCTIF